MTITTDRLILDPLTEGDCNETYKSWLEDTEVNRYLAVSKNPPTIEELIKYVEIVQKEGNIFFGIRIKHSHKHIGNIKLAYIDEYNGVADYSIMIGAKEEWGKGYAKEGTIAFLDYCFRNVQVHKITLGVIKEHQDAVRLYDQLGFQTEGELKKHRRLGDKYYDTIVMAIFKEEFYKKYKF